MAVKSVAKAVRFSDKKLDQFDKDRRWVHDFWTKYTPEGKDVDQSGDKGADWTEFEDDDDLFIDAVVDIQRFVYGDEGDAALGAKEAPATESEMDGLLGKGTFRRMVTWEKAAEDKIEEESPGEGSNILTPETGDFIIFKGKKVGVEGPIHIVTMDEPGGLSIKAKAKPRSKGTKKKGFSAWPGDIYDLAGKHYKYARLSNFVHWDAGWSAHGAFKMLIRYGLATCMGIDRPRKEDGQVICYQWLDPGKYYGWHGSAANPRSVMSYDLSNAVYYKHYDKYLKLCGIPRPVLRISSREKVGKGNPFLGMYKDQILSLLRVCKAIAGHLGMKYHWPVDDDGDFIGRNYKRLFKDPFHGTAEHRMLPSTSKWDCRGLFAQIVALLLSDDSGELMKEFQELTEVHRLHDAKWGPWLDKCKDKWEWKELWG